MAAVYCHHGVTLLQEREGWNYAVLRQQLSIEMLSIKNYIRKMKSIYMGGKTMPHPQLAPESKQSGKNTLQKIKLFPAVQSSCRRRNVG